MLRHACGQRWGVFGHRQIVNADQPQSQQLQYLYERGLYDSWWYVMCPSLAATSLLCHLVPLTPYCPWSGRRLILYISLMVLSCTLNKRCNLGGRLLSVVFLAVALGMQVYSSYESWYNIEMVSFTDYPVAGYVQCVSVCVWCWCVWMLRGVLTCFVVVLCLLQIVLCFLQRLVLQRRVHPDRVLSSRVFPHVRLS